jgi:hypothetical protein
MHQGNFTAAAASCKARNQTLLSIETAQEFEAIKNVFSNYSTKIPNPQL